MTEPVPEFSRPLNVDRLPAAGIEDTLHAKPAERAALAKRFDLLDLPLLTAHVTVKPEMNGTITVTGKVTADVVQRCVVTLEPIASHFDLPLDLVLVAEDSQNEGAGSPHADEEERELDYFSGGRVDLGELVAQQLGVNLDPYPRKPNATLPITEIGAKPQETHPFAQLAALAKKAKDKDKTDN